MRSLIAIAALLASVSVSAGELDGKGLKCIKRSDDPHTLFAEFRRGNVEEWFVRVEGYTAVLSDEASWNGEPYELSPTKIEWPTIGGTHELDRSTLLLVVRAKGQEEIANRWDCEVYNSPEAFREMLEAARLQKQAEIDAEMQDNKI